MLTVSAVGKLSGIGMVTSPVASLTFRTSEDAFPVNFPYRSPSS